MVLQLEVVTILAEDFQVPFQAAFSPLGVVIQQGAGKLAGKAGRKGNQPFGMRGEVGLINAGMVIEAFQLRSRGDRKQVLVTGHVFCQQDQVRRVFIARDVFVVHAARRKVGFEPDDRLDALSFGSLKEIQRAKHGAVIGQREGGHTQFFGAFNQCQRAAEAVEHRVSRVNVKMNECHF